MALLRQLMCHYQGVASFFLHGLQLIASCRFLYDGTEKEIIFIYVSFNLKGIDLLRSVTKKHLLLGLASVSGESENGVVRRS